MNRSSADLRIRKTQVWKQLKTPVYFILLTIINSQIHVKNTDYNISLTSRAGNRFRGVGNQESISRGIDSSFRAFFSSTKRIYWCLSNERLLTFKFMKINESVLRSSEFEDAALFVWEAPFASLMLDKNSNDESCKIFIYIKYLFNLYICITLRHMLAKSD